MGSEFRIDARVEDVANARIVAAHSVRGEDLFQLLDQLSARVSGSFDVEDSRLATCS